MYELRTVKYPKTTLEGHQTAITCVTQQSHSRVCVCYSVQPMVIVFNKLICSIRAALNPQGRLPPKVSWSIFPSSFFSMMCLSSGKNTPSSQLASTPDGGAEYSPNLGSANNSPADYLQHDDMPSAISPVVRTESNAAQPSSRSGSLGSKRDPVNITPFVTQAAAKVEGGAKQLNSVGESTTTTAFATPASQRAQTSSQLNPQWLGEEGGYFIPLPRQFNIRFNT